MAYCEHVGVNLHDGNVYGEMNFRYIFTSSISGNTAIFLSVSCSFMLSVI